MRKADLVAGGSEGDTQDRAIFEIFLNVFTAACKPLLVIERSKSSCCFLYLSIIIKRFEDYKCEKDYTSSNDEGYKASTESTIPEKSQNWIDQFLDLYPPRPLFLTCCRHRFRPLKINHALTKI